MFCNIRIAGNKITQCLYIAFIGWNVKNAMAFTNSNTIEKWLGAVRLISRLTLLD